MERRCDTKYPLLLVHGVGFRDRKHLCYWGRIPAALEKNGAVVFYGNQDSWGTIEGNAVTLKKTIEETLRKTGAEKVNIIAHSKGGLEARYVISTLGMGQQIASLTTVATPHHGSETMGLLCKLPRILFRFAGIFVNLWFRCLGDQKPDFAQACFQLSPDQMEKFNISNPDNPSVFYQSYTALMKRPTSDFIMFLPNLIISAIEGENDGLITPKSAQWGLFRGVWRGSGGRGISHPDEVDARRHNFSKTDIPECVSNICDRYVTIATELKESGF